LPDKDFTIVEINKRDGLLLLLSEVKERLEDRNAAINYLKSQIGKKYKLICYLVESLLIHYQLQMLMDENSGFKAGKEKI